MVHLLFSFPTASNSPSKVVKCCSLSSINERKVLFELEQVASFITFIVLIWLPFHQHEPHPHDKDLSL